MWMCSITGNLACLSPLDEGSGLEVQGGTGCVLPAPCPCPWGLVEAARHLCKRTGRGTARGNSSLNRGEKSLHQLRREARTSPAQSGWQREGVHCRMSPWSTCPSGWGGRGLVSIKRVEAFCPERVQREMVANCRAGEFSEALPHPGSGPSVHRLPGRGEAFGETWPPGPGA